MVTLDYITMGVLCITMGAFWFFTLRSNAQAENRKKDVHRLLDKVEKGLLVELAVLKEENKHLQLEIDEYKSAETWRYDV